MSQLITTYLQDHHAAAVAALDVYDRVTSGHSDTRVRSEVARLGAEAREDATLVDEIMAAVDVTASGIKDAAARLGERAGRLKLNQRVVSRSPLSDLVELEALVLAAHAQVLMLSAVAHLNDPRLEQVDVQGLLDRADAREAALEQLRLSQIAALLHE